MRLERTKVNLELLEDAFNEQNKKSAPPSKDGDLEQGEAIIFKTRAKPANNNQNDEEAPLN